MGIVMVSEPTRLNNGMPDLAIRKRRVGVSAALPRKMYWRVASPGARLVEYRTDTGNWPLLSMVWGQYTKSTSSPINVRVVTVLVLVRLDCVVVVAMLVLVVEVSVCVVDVSDLVVEVTVEVDVMVVDDSVVVDDTVVVVVVVTIGRMLRTLASDSRVSQCLADAGTMYSNSLYSSYEIPCIGTASMSVPTRAGRSKDCWLIWTALSGVSAALPVKMSSRLASSGCRLVEYRTMTVNPMVSEIYSGCHRTSSRSGATVSVAVLVVVVAVALVAVNVLVLVIVVVEVERGRMSSILFDDSRLSQRMSVTGTM